MHLNRRASKNLLNDGFYDARSTKQGEIEQVYLRKFRLCDLTFEPEFAPRTSRVDIPKGAMTAPYTDKKKPPTDVRGLWCTFRDSNPGPTD